MPVRIPDKLPATSILKSESVAVISESLAFAQDIRALRVIILNLMPQKPIAETQLLRLISNSPLQVGVTLLHPKSHRSRNTEESHLRDFYKTFEDIRHERFDCLIITGAPLGLVDFAEVSYWSELQMIMDWSRNNVYSTLYLCWAAMAGLHHHHSIKKRILKEKLCGVFLHQCHGKGNPLLHGFDDEFFVPHSRFSYVDKSDIARNEKLSILSASKEAGVYLVGTKDQRQIFVTGHPEYDALTLAEEYSRDKGTNPEVSPPLNYFGGDDPTNPPIVKWRGHGSLLFSNWLNTTYQNSPYDLRDLAELC